MTATPDTTAGRQTEAVMAALRRAGVLKEDEAGRSTHYNRAYSAVLEALSGPAPIFEPLDESHGPYNAGGRRRPYMHGR